MPNTPQQNTSGFLVGLILLLTGGTFFDCQVMPVVATMLCVVGGFNVIISFIRYHFESA